MPLAAVRIPTAAPTPPPVCWNRPFVRGATMDRIRLREYAIHPCIGCGYCSAHPGHCVFDGDDVADLFRRMEHADSLILNIPVYFYGPPALLKGFIDRAQIFWEQRREGTRTPRRPAQAVLCAARTQGDRLFEANLLILRCFWIRWIQLHEPLFLRGVEPHRSFTSQAIAQMNDSTRSRRTGHTFLS
ncbi:MAG: flavodoxin family protein [Bilophila wadsworthia]